MQPVHGPVGAVLVVVEILPGTAEEPELAAGVLPAAGEAGSVSGSAPASKGERSGKGRRRGQDGAAGDDKKDK